MKEKRARDIFPVGLLLEGEETLVVGGGKVAAHKAELLLSAKAAVTVTSPEISKEMETIISSIRYCCRPFSVEDLEGKHLVYAASNNVETNTTVREECRTRGILCCVVDRGWSEGDFITPSIIRNAGMTIAISSGGESCRKTRFYREFLERNLPGNALPKAFVIGVSHYNLNLDERSDIHLDSEARHLRAKRFRRLRGLYEFVILNTCNRIEVYGLAQQELLNDSILAEIMGFDSLRGEEWYLKTGKDAFSHSCNVVSGLLSQTPLEKYIVAQFKEAIEESIAQGWSGKLLREWLDGALHVSKDIRRAAATLITPKEIDNIAVSVGEEEGKINGEKTVFVVGTGELGSKIAHSINGKVQRLLWFYHTRCPEDLPHTETAVEKHSLTEMTALLKKADAVFLAVRSEEPLVQGEQKNAFDPNRQTLVIDLGAPRSIAASLKDSPMISIIDLDDLKHRYRRDDKVLARVTALTGEIIADHGDLYDKFFGSFH